jgi:hypothetical protein
MLNHKIQNAIDEFNRSSIVQYYNEKGDALAARVAEQKFSRHSQSTKKILSEIAKNRTKKTIEQKVHSKKGQEISKLLSENKLSINQIIKQVGCSNEYFYEIKTYLDGGILHKVDMINDHPQKGKNLTDEQKTKIINGTSQIIKIDCPYCNHKSLNQDTLNNHIKNLHRKIYSDIQHQKKIFNRENYMSPLECRNWLWNMGFNRGYSDPKYKNHIKSGKNLPEGFRTFPWIGPGKTNNRFFNKKLVERDNQIDLISKLYFEGNSLTIISETLKIPKTTLARIIKRNNLKTEITIGERQRKTHELKSTKKGRDIIRVSFKSVVDHINKYKIRTTREFKKSGFSISLDTIKKRFPHFNWEDYKYKN